MDNALPFANYKGRMVSPAEIEKHCDGLICPECGQPLIVRKGDVRIHHFAHKSGGGISCGETAVHLMAKQIIAESSYIVIPPVFINQTMSRIKILEAHQELRIENYIPDILLKLENNDLLAIEIFVNHKTEEDKIKFYRDKRILALEIDLSKQSITSEEDLKKILLDGLSLKYWLSFPRPPKQIIPAIYRPRRRRGFRF